MFRLIQERAIFTAVIADFGPLSYKVGIPFEKYSAEDDRDVLEKEEEMPGEEKNSLIDAINKQLEQTRLENVPWRDLKEKLKCFDTFDLVLFKFGQKQEIHAFADFIAGLSEKARIECAVGVEFNIANNVLYAGPSERNIGKEFYPQLLSSKIGNILIKEKMLASKLVKNCYRLCLYNTVEHVRRRGEKQPTILSNEEKLIGKEDKNEKNNFCRDKKVGLRELLTQSIEKFLKDALELNERGYSDSKLRIEGYFNLNSFRQER